MSDTPNPITTSKSGPFMTVTSAKQFDKQAVFEGYLLAALCQVKEYHEFVYTDVPFSWGEAALLLIDEKIPSRKTYNTKRHTLRIRVMSTWIHDCIQEWLSKHVIYWLLNQEITQGEEALLHGGVGTTLEFKYGSYSGSKREPDFFFRINDHVLPTLAVESGWMGGNGSIKIVVIVKWTKLQGGSVSGIVELFLKDRNGMPRLEQSEIVFPRPTPARIQRIGIRRGDLFGAALMAGRNRNDILYLDIERLRDYATRALRFMNLTPA